MSLAACQSSASESPAAARAPSRARPPARSATSRPTSTLQLQWLDQAQFAGYYAAVEQGYYDDVT